jgi:hypothetical protein
MNVVWLFRLMQVVPWFGILWLLSLGVDGHMSWLLVIVLLIIFLPGAIMVSLVSTLGVKGASAWRQMQQPPHKTKTTNRPTAEGRVKVTNMAETNSRHARS